jgi:hypothetical protein
MSTWKRKAIEFLPELKNVIETHPNPMSLWIELHQQLISHYLLEPRDDFISRFYQYARWCFFEAKNPDLANAVACAFYEHISTDKNLRDDLHRWLSRPDFSALSEAFRHLLQPDEFAEFEKNFLARKSAHLKFRI